MGKIGGVINIIFGLFVLYISFYGLGQYFGGAQSDIDKLNLLQNEGEKAVVTYANEYLEIDIGGGAYVIDFTFEVDSVLYESKHTFNSLADLENRSDQVTYFKSDPDINALEIEKQLESASEENHSIIYLILGIGVFIYGTYKIYSGIRSFRAPVSGNKV